MIYFLYAPEFNAIKIGYSTNAHGRIKDIRNMAPFVKMITLKIIEGTAKQEKSLHYKFAHLNYPTDTDAKEWFKSEPEIMNYIHNICLDVLHEGAICPERNIEAIKVLFPNGYVAKTYK